MDFFFPIAWPIAILLYGLRIFLQCLIRFCFGIVAIGTLLIVLPGIPPNNVLFRWEPAPERVTVKYGMYYRNGRLDGAEIVGTGGVEGATLGFMKGPESFAAVGNTLYTGIEGGDILSYDLTQGTNGTWQFLARPVAADGCQRVSDEGKCGRVLGMVVDPQGRLVFADAFHGIFRLDPSKPKTSLEHLIKSDHPDGGGPFFNSVAVGKSGKIYYTISSMRFSLFESTLELLSSTTPSGRALVFNPETGDINILFDRIVFANGIAVDQEETFVLISEVGKFRIVKIPLVNRPENGFYEFVSPTPGPVDNLKPNGRGGFLAGVIVPVTEDDFNLMTDFLLSYPSYRRAVARILYFLRHSFSWLSEVYPSSSDLAYLAYAVANTETTARMSPPSIPSMVVEYDANAMPVKTWQSYSEEVRHVCEGFLHTDGYLYLGSPWAAEVYRVKYQDDEDE